MSSESQPFGASFPPWPELDFSSFGETESRPLPKLQKFVSATLARNWAVIPHVTHHDEADITALEAHRKAANAANAEVKITPLAYFIKAIVKALQAYPQFNASLDIANNALIYKKYFNVGVAVDTPHGLLVPVIRNSDGKSIVEISQEIAAISERARTKGLPMKEMMGGCISISSLGGIGGTAFTPIINAPELAILGVTKSRWVPQRGADDAVEWRLTVPLDLSYDHRAINGADAARFLVAIAKALADPESLAAS
jgi:pyruvate dehydrogenase E2 component (dihydrolipoamide acetyltransferase)